MDKSLTNIVTSYPNPDTDGVACAIAMANLLSITRKQQWIPIVLGVIGDETLYVMQTLGIPIPTTEQILPDCNSIVLVDTHHKAQLPDEFPFEKVCMVVDHHPNGDDVLFTNAEIINEKIGAAATIVTRMFFKEEVLDLQIFSLLGFAILSNTLNFTAPSTTDTDKNMYSRIVAETVIKDDEITAMFMQRSLVFKNDMYSALYSDFKVFDTKAGQIGISQVEAYGLETLVDIHQAEMALQRIASEKQLRYCVFNGVDIRSRKSIVISANSDTRRLMESVFKMESGEEPLVFNRILLRKTDFVPMLNA